MQERHNPLFDRREVSIKISDRDSPPKKEEAVGIISEKFSSSPETIHIEKIEGKFGTKAFTITAEIYSSKENKESMNKINKKKKVAKSK